MRRFGAVCCRWHVAVFAVLFACSLMSLFCLDPKLVSTCVILAPSTVDSFMWARLSAAAVLSWFCHVTWVSLIPAPVCPWIPRVPVCPCVRVPVCPWIPRVPVCPEAREETYLQCVQPTHKCGRKSILVTDGAPCYPKLTSEHNLLHEACNFSKGIFCITKKRNVETC